MTRPRNLLDRFREPTLHPLVVGHRGYSSRAPENTMAAFRLIREHGVEGVELDVHRCASGEIVVAHDDTLERTAGSPLRLIQTPLASIREHDVGAWFSDAFRNERVPLLEEVFEELAGHAFFDIEIKHYATRFGRAREGSVEAETVRLVRRHGLVGNCIISSFDPFVVRRVRLLAPEIPAAAIYANTDDLPRFLRRNGGRFYSGAAVMKPNHASTTAHHVARHHRRGRLVMPWTVDDEALAVELANRGVDALITNRPGEIRSAVEGRSTGR
ncbi:MAG: glycerophosphodiester phosphodiesterase [Spirochaetota bacterium]